MATLPGAGDDDATLNPSLAAHAGDDHSADPQCHHRDDWVTTEVNDRRLGAVMIYTRLAKAGAPLSQRGPVAMFGVNNEQLFYAKDLIEDAIKPPGYSEASSGAYWPRLKATLSRSRGIADRPDLEVR